MKKILLMILCLGCFCLCGCSGPFNSHKAQKSLMFDGENYVWASSVKKTMSGGSENIYVPEGQELGSSTKMISICTFPNLADPVDTVSKLGALMKNTKGIVFEGDIYVNSKANAAVLDYFNVLTNADYAEMGIFKYSPDKSGGLKNIQFVYKFNPESSNSKKHQDTIKEQHEKWLKIIADSDIPDAYQDKPIVLENPDEPKD